MRSFIRGVLDNNNYHKLQFRYAFGNNYCLVAVLEKQGNR